MSTFKMIEKLGLSITTWGGDPRTSAVLAQELETLLQSALVVYRSKDGLWTHDDYDDDTHIGFLIGVKTIKKQTKAEAALEFMQMFVEQKTTWYSQSAWEEAKRILEMEE